MIDRSFIGRSFPPLHVDVEPGQLRAFARATGQRDPIYWDEEAAKAAGYRGLPAPLTFLFTLDQERDDRFYFINAMGIELGHVLHGEQAFTYGAPICAGDRVTLTCTCMDIYDKKGGAMEFVILKTQATNQLGEDLGGMTGTIVVRNPK
ncbi:MaoC family dehydratase N-terminal domain-containing protein [Pseudophaeobacter arcticus]|jgi:acyl dehydratase|uniref:MaoC family dehydratase N-terminal domain-containing protein n=1 Tax=Pseudophaeobacter arcticus TaxID=385492 RepID=UPI0024916844|nr:MaoC family dehydratase N-terminal domain-containing protein [Pseudophaeobacter arcticus]